MVEVGIWSEWELEVELDSEALARAVQWTVTRLVNECRVEDVPPVGALTITDRPVEAVLGLHMVRRSVNLQVDPDARWDWTVPETNKPAPAGRWARVWRWVKTYALLIDDRGSYHTR